MADGEAGCTERGRLLEAYQRAIALHQERQDDLAAVRDRFFATAAAKPFDLIRRPEQAIDDAAGGLHDLTAAELKERETGIVKTKTRTALIVHEATCIACRT
jgi:hypothetical protein